MKRPWGLRITYRDGRIENRSYSTYDAAQAAADNAFRGGVEGTGRGRVVETVISITLEDLKTT